MYVSAFQGTRRGGAHTVPNITNEQKLLLGMLKSVFLMAV